ncbi:hypothetical protein, partial [uncultured Rikenella sp.]|uniref:hypothetical protein n=1 Tax=uncultured Rikenella sp. TaxID=368003 RepID=UPI002631D204
HSEIATSIRFSRALAEILLEQFTMVLTISFSSSRARHFQPSPAAILAGLAPANRQNMPSSTGGRRFSHAS